MHHKYLQYYNSNNCISAKEPKEQLPHYGAVLSLFPLQYINLFLI
nr:MAG TPA: hypothetical protein [Caudoviricetes sp.]